MKQVVFPLRRVAASLRRVTASLRRVTALPPMWGGTSPHPHLCTEVRVDFGGETPPNPPILFARPPALFAAASGGVVPKDASPSQVDTHLPFLSESLGILCTKDALPSWVARWGRWGSNPSNGTTSSSKAKPPFHLPLRLSRAVALGVALVFGGIAGGALGAGAAWAQEESAGEMMAAGDLLFVDVQEVLIGSSAMLDIRRQVNDQITVIRSDAQAAEAELIEEEKQIKAEELSDEEAEARYRDLEDRLTRARNELSQRLQSVQNGAFEAQREVENHLTDIFNELREERGAALLVNPQGILSAELSYVIPSEQDLTDEVLLRLDERLSAVIVLPRVIPPVPEELAPSAGEALDVAEEAEESGEDAEGAAQ